MFLLVKETIFSKIDGYEFVPHYYGPFSRDLDSDLNKLIVSGDINDTEGFVYLPKGTLKSPLLLTLHSPLNECLLRYRNSAALIDGASPERRSLLNSDLCSR